MNWKTDHTELEWFKSDTTSQPNNDDGFLGTEEILDRLPTREEFSDALDGDDE